MSLKNNDSKELIAFLIIILLVILVFSYVLFGAIGIRIALGIILMSLPFYIVLNNFSLLDGEKFVFSALLGLTIFPSLVYLLGLVISFRMAIAAIFAVLIILVILLNKIRKK